MKTRAAIVGLALWLGIAATSARAAEFPLSAHNNAVTLTVTAATAQPNYGANRARAGKQFLVLATRWENRIDPKIADERGLAPAYGVDDLAQHLFLVIDGASLGALQAGLDGGSGRKSLGAFVVAKPGALASGDIVFEIPAVKYTSADLRFWDDVGGYMKLALAGAAPEPKPLFPAQKNAVAELAVFGFTDPEKGVTAPAGFRAVAVDLRGRSVWTVEGEASQYDPQAQPDAKVTRVNLLDWPELAKYVHVIADGSYVYPPETASVPDAPRLIPEFFTGWRLVFLVPATAKSLELLCEMPHAATVEGTLDLPPMHFPLSGTADAAEPLKGSLEIKDEMFTVVLAARRAETFAGQSPGEGHRFVLLDVEVTNHGETGEFFQPHDQLSLLDADGNEVPYDDVTAAGVHRPEENVHVPPGARRRFTVVYRIDAAIAHPRLSYRGGSFQQAYDLTPAP